MTTPAQQNLYGYFVSRGMTPQGANAAVAGLSAESGPSLDPLSLDTKDPGGVVANDAFGRAQWTSDRQTGLLDFANSIGGDVNSSGTQDQYIVHELQTKIPLGLGSGHRSKYLGIKRP